MQFVVTHMTSTYRNQITNNSKFLVIHNTTYVGNIVYILQSIHTELDPTKLSQRSGSREPKLRSNWVCHPETLSPFGYSPDMLSSIICGCRPAALAMNFKCVGAMNGLMRVYIIRTTILLRVLRYAAT